MRFGSIAVANLRCLEQIEYAPDPYVNLVTGPNGAGKTSLLEAFAMASVGKSFLSNRWSDVTRRGVTGMSVRATAISDLGAVSNILVRKVKSDTEISIDGLPIGAASILARSTPVLVFNSKAPDLLTENPSSRRALLDRTLFHVEQTYLHVWKAYRQALRQRNELVRTGARHSVEYWNERLTEYSGAIDQQRTTLVEYINGALAHCVLSDDSGILHFRYSPGWDASKPLLHQFQESWQRDRQAGCTTLGAHRADLALMADGRVVSKHLSRGQAKIVVCTLITALAGYIKERIQNTPVILVDDLSAELDETMRRRAVDMISAVRGQCIYTAIKPADLPEIAASVPTVFHVKHRSVAATA